MSSPLRHLPNILTGLRFLLVVPIIAAIIEQHYVWALGLFILAGITDGLDGLLARVYGWTSKFGAVADPIADKLLIVCSFIAFAWLGKFLIWLVVLIVVRDVWIVVGAFFYYLLFGRPEFSPSALSKINTFLQILLVVLLLLHFSFAIFPIILLITITWLTAITTALSLVHYTWMWGARAILEARRRAKLPVNLRGQS